MIRMKRVHLPGVWSAGMLLLLVLGGSRPGGHGALLFFDPFSQPDGSNLGAAGQWAPGTSGAGNNSAQIKVTFASAQTAPPGMQAAVSNGVVVTPAGQARAAAALLNGTGGVSSADGSVVYASFLLNVQDLPAANTRVAYLHDVTSSGGAAEVWINSAGQIGVRKKTGSPVFAPGTPVVSPGTHLVVIRYQFQAGHDPVALWVDPAIGEYGAAAAPEPAASITALGSDNGAGGIKYFIIDSPAAADSVYCIDEVRAGTAWADVTPAVGPGSSAPVITQAFLSRDSIILRGTNGPPGGGYHVLTSSNPSSPLADWPGISEHEFDSAGHFDSTNPVQAGAAHQFFRLLVDGPFPPAPNAPAITNQPQDVSAGMGETVKFLVGASGTEPLSYFWRFNTSTAAGSNSSTLTLPNVQPSDAGSYQAVVSNSAGSVTSSVAVLAVLSAPVILSQPQDQTVALSNNATFSVTAAGAAPLGYQWFFNANTPVVGGSSTLTIPNVQSNSAGFYTVVVTNSYGSITSAAAALVVGPSPGDMARFNLAGFGAGTTGGGVISENDPAWRKAYTALDFARAVRDANKTAGVVKVIEIMNDLNLGWNEIDPAVKTLASTPFTQPAAPLLHPVLLQTGVSTVQISPRGGGLTIFSANGATIRRASWSIKNTSNIIIRNLKFDELWEWDEQTKGDYDRNNWDFIVIGVGGGTVSRVWIDHCTFTKSYDGVIDTKGGADHITYSWNKYMGDDGATNPNSFVWQQIRALEASKEAHPMYSFLRTRGFAAEDIVMILQGCGKTHAIGELSLDPVNVNSCVTFHHQWYINPWDRLPRLAGGTVHNFNIYVDAAGMLAARRLRDAKVAAMSPGDQATFANNYSFRPSGNGSISTENGAMLVEKSYYRDCVWPLRNNQTDPSNPVYTGKIKATDTIYSFLEANGSTTLLRGNSTDPGNPLGPFQAPVIPFSWNTNSGTPNGELPYSCPMDDPADVPSIVSSPVSGAGAGVLTWNKTNWLKTTY